MRKVIKERMGKPMYNQTRIFIEDKALEKIGFVPGSHFEVSCTDEEIELTLSEKGLNKVSAKTKRDTVIPVIDKSGPQIREVLSKSKNIVIRFVEDDAGSHVIIQAVMSTADNLKAQRQSDELTCITFCAGAGISSDVLKQVGFIEKAAVEYNPKAGAEDKYANIYSKNHPESVMFNIPMELLDANDLPNVDCWVCTLDCTDYSNLSSTKSYEDYKTIHLPMILMKLFYQREKSKRPRALMVENVPNFEKVAGNSIRLCLESEGYNVTTGVINSLDYGSRTERKRFFLMATIYEGFTFPDFVGRLETPICSDGVITVETLDWVSPEENGTLGYFLGRESKIRSGEAGHNHKLITYDITADNHIGTIPKSHGKIVPENWIRHPSNKNKFAYILDVEQLKYLQDIRKDIYLGDSRTTAIQCIGQSVCCKTFRALAGKLYQFLKLRVEPKILYTPVMVVTRGITYEQIKFVV